MTWPQDMRFNNRHSRPGQSPWQRSARLSVRRGLLDDFYLTTAPPEFEDVGGRCPVQTRNRSRSPVQTKHSSAPKVGRRVRWADHGEWERNGSSSAGMLQDPAHVRSWGVREADRVRAETLGLVESFPALDVDRGLVGCHNGPCDGCLDPVVCDVVAAAFADNPTLQRVSLYVCLACRADLYTRRSLYAKELDETVVPVFRF